MKVTKHIEKSNGKTLFSFEIIPPRKGKNIEELYNNIDPLMEFNPPFIDVTTSREEYIYIERGKGLLERKLTRMRPGSLGICASIKHKYNVDTIPHVLCGGFTKEETEYLLVDCHYLGIDNIMALRGDSMRHEPSFIATDGGNLYASDLVNQISKLNNGIYLHELIEVVNKSDFCIGVAGYPEKHFEAPNMQNDLMHLKAKVDAGADYIMTQMFFDNNKFFQFVKDCRAIGIEVPIIPGLKPITNKKQLTILPKIFHVDIPTDLSDAILKAKTDQEMEEIGTQWLIQQSKELKAFGVPVLHYYTLGKPNVIYNAVKKIV